MKTWISSDLHFYHKNVIGFCNRPYDSVEEMNEGIINNFNSVIKPEDKLILLGDLAFTSPLKAKKLIDRINGKKFLVVGNHDSRLVKNEDFRNSFECIYDYLEETVSGHKVCMFHFPILNWNRKGYGSIHLFGHQHGDEVDLGNGRYKDVGVDTNNMMPYNLIDLVDGLVNSSDFILNSGRSHHGV